MAKALCQLKASESLQGLSTWCKKQCERDFAWLEAMIHKSKGRSDVGTFNYCTQSSLANTCDFSCVFHCVFLLLKDVNK